MKRLMIVLTFLAFFLCMPIVQAAPQPFSITRISTDSSGNQVDNGGYNASISADGSKVAFDGGDAVLDADCTAAPFQTYIRIIASNALDCASTSSAGVPSTNGSTTSSLSGDGNFLLFRTNSNNVVAGDTNGVNDLFLKNLQTGVTTRISTDSSGAQVLQSSQLYRYGRGITDDGRYIVFASLSSALVAGDSNLVADVFMKDTQTNATTRLSVSSTGTEANGMSDDAEIAANGRYVTFWSRASNLVTGDTNTSDDIFRKDTQTGAIEMVSKTQANVLANDDSLYATISADGNLVAFDTLSTNLGPTDTNNDSDIYIKNMTTGELTLVSRNGAGTIGDDGSYRPVLSANGRYVAFLSYATNLTSEDTQGNGGVYVKDLQTGNVALISKSNSNVPNNNFSENVDMTADGRYIVFESSATNLAQSDTNNDNDIFLAANPLWDIPDTAAASPGTIAAGDTLADTGRDVYTVLGIALALCAVVSVIVYKNRKYLKI